MTVAFLIAAIQPATVHKHVAGCMKPRKNNALNTNARTNKPMLRGFMHLKGEFEPISTAAAITMTPTICPIKATQVFLTKPRLIPWPTIFKISKFGYSQWSTLQATMVVQTMNKDDAQAAWHWRQKCRATYDMLPMSCKLLTQM
jgi:hypothetical protein